jgi:hypothetical protein
MWSGASELISLVGSRMAVYSGDDATAWELILHGRARQYFGDRQCGTGPDERGSVKPRWTGRADWPVSLNERRWKTCTATCLSNPILFR